VTASSNRQWNPTVRDVIISAYQVAGLMNEGSVLSAPRLAAAKLALNSLLKLMSADGLPNRHVVFENLTVTAGTANYELGGDTVDVIGSAVWINEGVDPEQPSNQTPVEQVSLDVWHQTNTKSAEGVPNRFWLNRSGETLSVTLWPIPTGNGTFRYKCRRFISDVNDDSATLDLERYWVEPVILRLAHRLAMMASMPIGTLQYLDLQARGAAAAARSASSDHQSVTPRVDHRTGWENR